jgi:hypothetical protein
MVVKHQRHRILDFTHTHRIHTPIHNAMFTLGFVTVALGSLATLVAADSHRINVVNKCNYGTPTLFGPVQNAPFKNVSFLLYRGNARCLTVSFSGPYQHLWRLLEQH